MVLNEANCIIFLDTRYTHNLISNKQMKFPYG